jgi:hypothetical protein
MGERRETAPTAKPPRKRAIRKLAKVVAKAVATDVIANNNATKYQ